MSRISNKFKEEKYIQGKENYFFPQLIENLDNIQKIYGGPDRSFALTITNNVYGWGNNEDQRLGIISTSQFNENIIKTPTLIPALCEKNIENIAVGIDHNFAWSSETGEVYAWGSGTYGKLGFGNTENLSEPTIMDCFKDASIVGMKITSIACGDNHTLAILNTLDEEKKEENSKLFVWGCSKNWQLGLENDFCEDILIPHQIDPDPWNGTISYTIASNNYSAALNIKGEVFTWGSGEFGRLGYKTETKQQKTPKIISFFSDIIITKVSLGGYHAAALSEDGEIYTWGRGINGQLGHGSMTNEEIPKLIKNFNGIKLINLSCGENHTLAISEKGELFGWGANQFGQLGVPNVIRSKQPIKISLLDEKMVIVDLSCGKKHSLVLNNQGQIFGFGSNEYGQLGISISKKSKIIKATQLRSPSDVTNKNRSPKINESLISKGIIRENSTSIEKTATFLGMDTKTPHNNVEIPANFYDTMQISQIQDPYMRKLMLENKILKTRIQELEFREDLSVYQQREQNIYDLAKKFIKNIEENLTLNLPDNFDIEIVNKNAKIDQIFNQFGKEIEEEKEGNSNTGFFCKQLIEKYAKLIKKVNFLTEKR